MPVTLTFHIGKITVTVTIKYKAKSNNRHSAK